MQHTCYFDIFFLKMLPFRLNKILVVWVKSTAALFLKKYKMIFPAYHRSESEAWFDL